MLDTTPAAAKLSDRPTQYKKKLIEVALPLQAINKASAREKSPQRGRPSTLHLWWARRPLSACRAVLFASLVDDPSSHPDLFPTLDDQERERKRLFGIIEALVERDIGLSERVLSEARDEIAKSTAGTLPMVYDPFCGGGSIPIEAQRFGLPTLASDLNPVAVLITKALTEIPWRFRGRSPVHPSLRGPLHQRNWERATGLAADVEAYGNWVLEEARKRLTSFYPTLHVPGREQASVIAWLWARTVHCPNPLCGAKMPLIKSFALSTKTGKEWCFDPIVDRAARTVSYETRSGKPVSAATIDRRGARCIVCNEPVTLAYIRSEGKAGRIAVQMIAIVGDGPNGRVYFPPNEEHVRIARSAQPTWTPDTDLPQKALGFRVQAYGMTKHRHLFTERQLLALTTLTDLVRECRGRVVTDATAAGMSAEDVGFEAGGSKAVAYADAVAAYLGMSVDRLADYNAALCSWHSSEGKIRNVFSRQTLSMVWDFAEANPIRNASGSLSGAIDLSKRALAAASAASEAIVIQRDAAAPWESRPLVVCTDPPYYDNVPYADLSDFFYIWLRLSLKDVYPDLFGSLLVPKTQELIAEPARFNGDAEKARQFFEQGLGAAFQMIRRSTRPEFPTTVFYAFKETEESDQDAEIVGGLTRSSVGWEAMLGALLGSGFQITGTWPVRTELANRTRGQNSNALASSIVLVCRPRPDDAPRCTRTELLHELRAELPDAVKRLREANLAATDLEQAALGPGMAIFSRYRDVLEPSGTRMSIASALALINDELARTLLGEIADVDAETQFALSWFESHAYDVASFGEADVLLKAKNAGLSRLTDYGVIQAARGTVRLLNPRDLTRDNDRIARPLAGAPIWPQLMYLIAALVSETGSESVAASALRTIGSSAAGKVKDTAYHCYLVCSRLRRSAEAQDFNILVTAWPALERLSREYDGQTLF